MLFVGSEVRPLQSFPPVPDELPVFRVPEVHADDFDGNLNRTAAAMGGLIKTCVDLSYEQLGPSAFQDEIARSKASGGSYMPLDTITKAVGDHHLEIIRTSYRNPTDDLIIDPNGNLVSMAMPYADSLIYQARLAAGTPTPNWLITYGERASSFIDGGWQLDKVQRAGWEGFMDLLDDPKKGPRLADYQDPETGDYHVFAVSAAGQALAELVAPLLIITEDKEKGLTNRPQNTRGLLTRRHGEVYNDDPRIDREAERIEVVTSLADVAIDKTPPVPLNKLAERFSLQEAPIAGFIPRQLLAPRR